MISFCCIQEKTSKRKTSYADHSHACCPNRFQVHFMVTGRFRPSLLKKLFGRRLRSDFQCTSCIRSHHPRTLCNKMASYAARDLLAPSLPLHRNDTTDDGKIQCTELTHQKSYFGRNVAS